MSSSCVSLSGLCGKVLPVAALRPDQCLKQKHKDVLHSSDFVGWEATRGQMGACFFQAQLVGDLFLPAHLPGKAAVDVALEDTATATYNNLWFALAVGLDIDRSRAVRPL